jgi:hypothetical protein
MRLDEMVRMGVHLRVREHNGLGLETEQAVLGGYSAGARSMGRGLPFVHEETTFLSTRDEHFNQITLRGDSSYTELVQGTYVGTPCTLMRHRFCTTLGVLQDLESTQASSVEVRSNVLDTSSTSLIEFGPSDDRPIDLNFSTENDAFILIQLLDPF